MINDERVYKMCQACPLSTVMPMHWEPVCLEANLMDVRVKEERKYHKGCPLLEKSKYFIGDQEQ